MVKTVYRQGVSFIAPLLFIFNFSIVNEKSKIVFCGATIFLQKHIPSIFCQLNESMYVYQPTFDQLTSIILLLAVPRRLFCSDSLVVLDVVFRYWSLFVLHINIKIGKNGC